MKCPRTALKMLTIAAILLGTPVALADYGGPSEIVMRQCATLSKQFDQAKAAHKTDKSYKEALTLDTQGKTLCSTSYMEGAGVEHLRSALKLIGITPSM